MPRTPSCHATCTYSCTGVVMSLLVLPLRVQGRLRTTLAHRSELLAAAEGSGTG